MAKKVKFNANSVYKSVIIPKDIKDKIERYEEEGNVTALQMIYNKHSSLSGKVVSMGDVLTIPDEDYDLLKDRMVDLPNSLEDNAVSIFDSTDPRAWDSFKASNKPIGKLVTKVNLITLVEDKSIRK